MSRRIIVNLIVFGVLGVVLTVWALRNVVTFDVLSQPYRITAEFEASPGLQPNFDVAYLGVTVGKIKSVRLGDHKVIAELDIDKGASIPGNVTAAAGRQSAIGEPYVDLELPPGTAGAAPMRPGAVIPQSRTSVAVSYGDLFAAANKAVNGLNAADLHTLTHELGVGWDGRGDSLQKILDSSEQITGTFARNTGLLNTLIAQLTQTSGTLAAHSGEFGSGLDNLTAFTDALAQSSGQLTQIRQQTPQLLTRFNAVVSATAPANICTLAALGAALPSALSPAAVSSLQFSTQHSPVLVKVLNEISPKVNGKSNLNIDFIITLDKPTPALEYRTPLPLPTVGAIPTCPGVAVAPGTTTQVKAVPTAAGQRAGGQPPTGTVTTRSAAGESPFRPTNWLIYIPPLIALAILIRVAGRALPVLRRRRGRK